MRRVKVVVYAEEEKPEGRVERKEKGILRKNTAPLKRLTAE
jgi:hypothetical protein